MKLAFQLAYRNLMGAGLRTWLNVIVLSFAFVVIIFYNGMIDGWNEQAMRDNIAWEYANGHLLHEDYDPLDPFTLEEGHGKIPSEGASKNLTPILIRQASIYPDGRMVSASLKGIDVNQDAVRLPTQILKESKANIPALIGKRMAEAAKLKEGDEVLLRWRDKNGTFDAANITVAGIFDTNVGTIDTGQIWVSLEKLWEMTGLNNHATLFINRSEKEVALDGWTFKSQKVLTKSLTDLIETKQVSGSIVYLLLLAIALLAIFDTQVLSIFRRQREIGTYIAMGMTRWQVVKLFTVEGSMYSILATIVGCIYGIPLFMYMAKTGIGIPPGSQDMGVTIGDRIYPVYGVALILGTVLVVVISATIVSFMPARKIAKMNPVDALKGKMQ
jgi:putative ABC transport system permease protein